MPALGELIQDFFAIATVCGQDGVYCAMIGQGFRSAFRHSVHREKCCEVPDVEAAGRLRILGSGASPVPHVSKGP
jgi:hypothetical protein